MAINLFTGAVNSNWNNAGNWSLAAFPLVGDGNITTFSNLSPNCTVNVTSAANSIDFSSGTGYTNTITMTLGLSVAGNITLGGNMGISGAGALICTAVGTATLTSNGKTWPNAFTFGGVTTVVITLADAWSVTGLSTFSNTGAATSLTVNGFPWTTAGGLTVNTAGNRIVAGTTNIVLTGGTWLGGISARLQNNLELKGNITVSGNVYVDTSTLLYTSGTITVTGSTLNIVASTSLNTTGISWNNITILGTSQTITLLSNLTCTGIFTNTGAATQTFTGNFNISCGTFTTGVNTTTNYIFPAGQTLTVNTAFTSNGGTSAAHTKFTSSTTSPFFIDLNPSATQDINFMNFTWVTATEQTIWDFKGTLSNTVNINNYTSTYPTTSYGFVE